MRVAYVCADPGVPVFGSKGASVHVQEVLRGLLRAGASPALFATRVGGDPPPDLAGVPLVLLPPVGGGDPAGRERSAVAANAGLAEALNAAGRLDLLYERYSLWSIAGMAFARRRGVPGILEVNAPLPDEQARHRSLVDRAGADRVARKVVDLASAVVAVSEPVARWVRSRVSSPARVHVVPNGVDPDRFAAARPRDEPRGFTVGFVGTLKPWHGVETLVRACALPPLRTPDHRLLIVGDGPQRPMLERLVDRLRLRGATTFTGTVAHARVPALLRRMDVGTAPYCASADDYFSPLKICEYLAAELPVVSSAAGQAGDVIAGNGTGLLTPPGDVRALAQALRTLRDDPALRRALGAAGRRWVVEHRSWDAVAARILELAASSVGRVA